MREVTFCDSSGLGLMLQLHRTVEGSGKPFAIFDPSPQVQRVLELSGAVQTLNIRTS